MNNNFLDEQDELDIALISDYVRNHWKYEDYETMKIKIRDKYRIISLFVDPQHRKTIKSQEKNHSTLKKDKMTYLVSEAFIKLFLSVCKLYGNPINIKPEDQQRMNPAAFRRLIEGHEEEMEMLEDKVERLEAKNLQGYMLTSEHNKMVSFYKEEIRDFEDRLIAHQRRLEDQEKYYKEKLEKVTERHQKAQKHLSKHIQDKATIDQAKDIVNYDSSDSTD